MPNKARYKYTWLITFQMLKKNKAKKPKKTTQHLESSNFSTVDSSVAISADQDLGQHQCHRCKCRAQLEAQCVQARVGVHVCVREKDIERDRT